MAGREDSLSQAHTSVKLLTAKIASEQAARAETQSLLRSAESQLAEAVAAHVRQQRAITESAAAAEAERSALLTAQREAERRHAEEMAHVQEVCLSPSVFVSADTLVRNPENCSFALSNVLIS